MHEVAQVGAALEGHAGDVGPEQVAQRARHQVAAGRVVAHCQLGDDADTQAQPHVGLDDVGVDRLQRQRRLDAGARERQIDAGAAGDGGVVHHQRVGGELLQRRPFDRRQRVSGRHHHHMLPLVAGQGDQGVVVGQGLGGQPDLGHVVEQHARHLVRHTLVQHNLHFWEPQAQPRNGLGQEVACLGMRRGDRQCAGVLLAEVLADALEVGNLAHDDLDRFQHLLPGLRYALDAFAVACKQLYAKLFFELDDGLADTRLRGVQRLRGLGQVQAAAHRFLDELELVQIHASAVSRCATATAASASITVSVSPAAVRSVKVAVE